jgi:hypothetical protein
MEESLAACGTGSRAQGSFDSARLAPHFAQDDNVYKNSAGWTIEATNLRLRSSFRASSLLAP